MCSRTQFSGAVVTLVSVRCVYRRPHPGQTTYATPATCTVVTSTCPSTRACRSPNCVTAIGSARLTMQTRACAVPRPAHRAFAATTAPATSPRTPRLHAGKWATAPATLQRMPRLHAGKRATAPATLRRMPRLHAGKRVTAPATLQRMPRLHAGKLATACATLQRMPRPPAAKRQH